MTDMRHPLTWWIWSIALALGIARGNNPWLAIAVVGCAYLVVRIFRSDAPWSRSFESGLKLGLWILIIRTSFGVLIGTPIPGTTIFRLPILPLPDWMAGIRIGGAVTQERLFSTAHEGVILAAIIICFAAASSLTSPHRLLRVLPFAIYQFGLALVIATSLVPQFVRSISRIKDAQYLRGQKLSFKKILIPLLEESLARSLDLAAAMDSRGYGSTRVRSRYRAITWNAGDTVICGVSALSLFSPALILISVVTPFVLIKRKLAVPAR
jgi:energy-coupling factor transporter transmembrane protein EcfT